MNAPENELVPLRTEQDVMHARQIVRTAARDIGFSLVDQTKIVTAASELARNAIIHGHGGALRFEKITEGVRRGLRLTFEDNGPGIADISLALTGGWSTGTGVGFGIVRLQTPCS